MKDMGCIEQWQREGWSGLGPVRVEGWSGLGPVQGRRDLGGLVLAQYGVEGWSGLGPVRGRRVVWSCPSTARRVVW